MRTLTVAAAAGLLIAYAFPASAQSVTNEYFEEPLFDQPILGQADEHLYIGRHRVDPNISLRYYHVKTGAEPELLPKDVMNLVFWADDLGVRLQASGASAHLSPWTGVQPASPYSLYQYSRDAAWPGSSGFQTHADEVGINIHSPTFPMNNSFNKGTQVLSYDFRQPPLPFERTLRDEIEFSFDLAIPTAAAAGDGAVNVWGYLLLNDDSSSDKVVCLGAGAFDLRQTEGQTTTIFGDPDSGCVVAALPLGKTPEFNLSDGSTAPFSHAPAPGYKSYKLTMNGTMFRDLLKRINDHLISINKPLFSYDPSVYSLRSVIFNPEIYMPNTADTYAQIGLGVRNLRALSRMTYPVIGYVDTIQNEAAGWFVSGWACAKSWESPITVALFAGQSYEMGGAYLASGAADLPNTGSENQACSTAAGIRHRFKIQIPASALAAQTPTPLYVHARRELPGEPSTLLSKSGGYQMGNGAVAQIPLVNVYRWVRGSDRTYGTDPHEYESVGYANEGVLFKAKTAPSPGAVPLYRCVVPGRTDHFIWTSADCNGNFNEGFLGYAEANAVQGMNPIYLFYHPGHQAHLATSNLAEGWANGYILQYTPAAQLGYVW